MYIVYTDPIDGQYLIVRQTNKDKYIHYGWGSSLAVALKKVFVYVDDGCPFGYRWPQSARESGYLIITEQPTIEELQMYILLEG